MTMEHTPTPWHYDTTLNGDGSMSRMVFGPSKMGANVSEVVATTNKARLTYEADARFIVTAVNSYASSQAEIARLREALNKIVSNWSDLHPKDLAQARAALAEAQS